MQVSAWGLGGKFGDRRRLKLRCQQGRDIRSEAEIQEMKGVI